MYPCYGHTIISCSEQENSRWPLNQVKGLFLSPQYLIFLQLLFCQQLRREGVRLFMLWFQALQENSDEFCQLIFACLVPGFPNPVNSVEWTGRSELTREAAEAIFLSMSEGGYREQLSSNSNWFSSSGEKESKGHYWATTYFFEPWIHYFPSAFLWEVTWLSKRGVGFAWGFIMLKSCSHWICLQWQWIQISPTCCKWPTGCILFLGFLNAVVFVWIVTLVLKVYHLALRFFYYTCLCPLRV